MGVSNDGAISTRFTALDQHTGDAAKEKVTGIVNGEGGRATGFPSPLVASSIGAAANITDAARTPPARGDADPRVRGDDLTAPEDHLHDRLFVGRLDKRREGKYDSVHPLNRPCTEDELLERAFDTTRGVGNVRLNGREVLTVVGGGAIAGYGSSEIIVTFAPLSVGDFEIEKVRYCDIQIS